MSKRQSLMPAAPPTPVHIVSHPRCKNPVMADGLSITGTFPVFVGGDSVIHQKCKLDAKTGPVKVGMRCIVEERAVIGGAATSLNAPGVVPEGTVKMGDYVTIETGAMVDAGVTINTGCQIGQKCQIGAGAVLGKYCSLSPRTIIQPGEKLPDYTVVYGGVRRRDGREGAATSRQKNQFYKLETLQKLIPNMSVKYVPAEAPTAV